MSFKVGDIVVMVDDVLNLKNTEGVVIEVIEPHYNVSGMLRIDFGNKRQFSLWPRRVKKVLPNMWLKLEKSLNEIVIHD